MEKQSALLVVDVQNDFCPGGALPVPDGDDVVPVLNRYMDRFGESGLPVYASRDWHPPETKHFKEWGGPWPPHCVQGTPGAEFHPALALPADATVVSKGMDPVDHGYTAFDGVTAAGESLEDSIEERGIGRLYVGGLATDYCVRASVLDAREAGFDVVLLQDAIRGIDVEPGDIERSEGEMRDAGARIETIDEVEEELSA